MFSVYLLHGKLLHHPISISIAVQFQSQKFLGNLNIIHGL